MRKFQFFFQDRFTEEKIDRIIKKFVNEFLPAFFIRIPGFLLLDGIFKEKKFNSSAKKDLKSALNSISSNKPLFITGSLYLMGEVLKLFSVKELDF